MRSLLFIILVISYFTTSAQNNKLIGTTVLTASNNNMAARWNYGYFLTKFVRSDCEGSEVEIAGTETPVIKKDNSIKYQFENDTTLIVEIKVWENCAFDFLGEIEIDTNNVLKLIYYGYGGEASCNCCFGLTYKIHLLTNEDYDLSVVKYIMINNFEGTKTVLKRN